jgi:hypothetical protein
MAPAAPTTPAPAPSQGGAKYPTEMCIGN